MEWSMADEQKGERLVLTGSFRRVKLADLAAPSRQALPKTPPVPGASPRYAALPPKADLIQATRKKDEG
jgi:hypothetical protein